MIDFTDANLQYVLMGSLLLAASSALVGCFTFLRKKALMGDAIAHAVLPGVCLGFMLSGSKNPLFLVLGATVTGWLSVIGLDFITRNTKIKEDTATGLVLSVSFGVGIFLLTMIQNSGNAAQAGLNNFLFGKAASLLPEDILVIGGISLLLISSVIVFYKEFKLVAFDPLFAEAAGISVKKLDLLLTTLTVLAVVVGIQAVGVVLMAAMLITPAAAARFWTNRLSSMLLLAVLFGAFSGIAGTLVSLMAPAMPTGPWMVVVLSTIAIASFFFAPAKGIFKRTLAQQKFKRKINDENLLKRLYRQTEHTPAPGLPIHTEQLAVNAPTTRHLQQQLKRLQQQGYLLLQQKQIQLTQAGYLRGQRVVKLHRLWEVYLTQYMQLNADHVHDDAEDIEHFLTPELEKMLEKKLNYPAVDPHQNKIPYSPL